MNNQFKRLMVITGGTGGHVFPGIVVAQHLICQGWQVRWLGTIDRIESDLVPKHGIEIDYIRIANPRKNIKNLLLMPIYIFNAYLQARVVMKRFKPNVVLGMGGYIACPSGLAAWSLRIPIVIHEQNSIAGLTNKWLARIASKVMQAFPNALPDAEVVGNPIRVDILALPHPKIRIQGRRGPIRVLVIGGSQGASVLNKIMPQVAKKLGEMIIIWHQSGKGFKQNVENAYLDTGKLQYKVTEFIDDISKAYGWADIIVCRSGALTVSEIAVVGLAAIFVPFQHKDRQQYWNALPLEEAGAAKIFEHSQFTADAIAATLASWDREILLNMAICARSAAISDATERIVQRVNLMVSKS